ncbi:MAG: hypothetical protein FWF35_05350 [Elusimicrobia bacterium]|nr:hypothetical protein [Elusimicrobiota bacterium]
MKKIILFAFCIFALAYAAMTQVPGLQVYDYEVDALNAAVLKPGDRVDVLQLVKIDGMVYARTSAQNAVVQEVSGGKITVKFDDKSKYLSVEREVLKTKIIVRNPGDGVTRDMNNVTLANLFR